eukprot:COSAG05_NODE_1561_length_4559_cov_17.478924_1_plen_83_part_10
MPKAKEWCDAEKKALAALLIEHGEPQRPAEWQALAAQMPAIKDYPPPPPPPPPCGGSVEGGGRSGGGGWVAGGRRAAGGGSVE